MNVVTKSVTCPTLVSWTVKDTFENSVELRSNEKLKSAIQTVLSVNPQPDGLFVNCSKPEVIKHAVRELNSFKSEVRFIGAYGNAFENIPDNWRVESSNSSGGIKGLGHRQDLSVKMYEDCVKEWIDSGANVVGGCCQIGVEYIERLSELLRKINE